MGVITAFSLLSNAISPRAPEDKDIVFREHPHSFGEETEERTGMKGKDIKEAMQIDD